MLIGEIADLLVEARQTIEQSDHLLHEQVSEQCEQHAQNDRQHQQCEQ